MTAGLDVEWLRYSWTVIIAVAAGGAAVAAGIWAIATRLVRRLENRRARRRRGAALNVHPWLFAAEDLQSRLYEVLETRGLEPLMEPSNPHPFAEETVYLIAQYFGWERSILRHGPYAGHRKTVRLVRAIRDAFATDTLDPAMRFTRSEQGAIAELMLKRVQGQFGTEFEAISLLEFVDATRCTVPVSEAVAARSGRRPSSTEARQAGLAQIGSLRRAVDTLRGVTSPDTVPGAQRLARIQTRLVALLTHLEKRERISLCDHVRGIAVEEKHVRSGLPDTGAPRLSLTRA